MAKQNDMLPLALSLLLTSGLLVGGGWWIVTRTNLISGLTGNTSDTSVPPLNTPSEGSSNTEAEPVDVPSQTSTGQTLAEVADVPSGLFNYGGSTTWATIRGEVDPVLRQTFPQFQLRYADPINRPPGSTIGIQMVLDGQLAFSQSSSSLRDQDYQQAQQRGFTLQQIPVALEGIAIAVHPTLNVPGITTEQLVQIYTGQITNWNEVGGPNLPITPYSRQDVGGTVEFFVTSVMGGSRFGTNVQYMDNTTLALRAVANDLGGIYYASAPEVVGQCTTKPLPLGRQSGNFVAPYVEPLVPASQCPAARNQLNTEAFRTGDYPITRPMYVIVKQNGQQEQRAGEAYANLLLTDEGQSLLTDAGFVPLR